MYYVVRCWWRMRVDLQDYKKTTDGKKTASNYHESVAFDDFTDKCFGCTW